MARRFFEYCFLGFFIILTLVVSHFSYASIINYRVTESVPLGLPVSIEGTLNPAASGVLCSISIYDVNSGQMVKRLTDEFTSSSGYFASNYFIADGSILEETSDYNAITNCAGSTAAQKFNVAQRKDLSQIAFGTTLYLQNNAKYLVWLVIVVLVVLCGAFIVLNR